GDDLLKLGLDRPTVAGQLMLRVAPQVPFEIAGDGPPGWHWTAAGRLADAPHQHVLDLTLTAGDRGAGAAKTGAPVLLRTQIKLNSTKMMLVGAAPTGPTMSAFAVQVSASVPGKAQGK